VADVLDFPLDPPNGAAVARGGRDFGVFRGRFDKYHAGEDWWRVRGGSNFGEPVYSVGHGLVTYAQPEGWGRDKGVVVIRHNFSDESTILSFYGHLDPPSVTLVAGECVARGEMIGKIGRPSSPPHLHLEIRSHLPYQPGTGYWPTDPALAGWEPPSQYISNKRIVASPGVVWTRPPTVNGVEVIGILQDGTLVAVEKEQFIGLDTIDGSLRWSLPISDTIDASMADARQQMIYTANQIGTISSYRQAAAEGDDGGGIVRTVWSRLWSADYDFVGFPTLMPLSLWLSGTK
jgi:murein DD-endopeptidase MepM/ murein hydrolase activator NlpD